MLYISWSTTTIHSVCVFYFICHASILIDNGAKVLISKCVNLPWFVLFHFSYLFKLYLLAFLGRFSRCTGAPLFYLGLIINLFIWAVKHFFKFFAICTTFFWYNYIRKIRPRETNPGAFLLRSDNSSSGDLRARGLLLLGVAIRQTTTARN